MPSFLAREEGKGSLPGSTAKAVLSPEATIPVDLQNLVEILRLHAIEALAAKEQATRTRTRRHTRTHIRGLSTLAVTESLMIFLDGRFRFTGTIRFIRKLSGLSEHYVGSISEETCALDSSRSTGEVSSLLSAPSARPSHENAYACHSTVLVIARRLALPLIRIAIAFNETQIRMSSMEG